MDFECVAGSFGFEFLSAIDPGCFAVSRSCVLEFADSGAADFGCPGDSWVGGGGEIENEEVIGIGAVDTKIAVLPIDGVLVAEIDGVLVAAKQLDPITHDIEEGLFVRGDVAGGRGAQIHEEVGSGCAGSAQDFDDAGGANHVVIAAGGTPVEVAGHAHFSGVVFFPGGDLGSVSESSFEGDGIDFAVGEFAFFAQASIVNDQGVRLMFSDQRIKFVEFPIGLGLRPVSIEPESAQGAVIPADDFD